jgi:aryl-alcohol dehydrogenase-like predicted oxidoreductase
LEFYERPLDPKEGRPIDVVDLARDAIHGSLYEMQWREPFARIPENVYENARQGAIKRLRKLPEQAVAIPCTAPMVIPPRIGWGTYGWKYDHTLVKEALTLGVPLLDTSETYGFGRVEKELGAALGKDTRETRIATKVSRNHMTYGNILRAADRSAYTLGVPIGLFQTHWPNISVPTEDTYQGLNEVLAKGTARFVGACNLSVDQFYTARQTCPRLASIQVRLDGLGGVLPYFQAMGIAVIAHSPLGQGRDISERRSIFQWCLENRVTPIVGTNNVEHLRENARL